MRVGAYFPYNRGHLTRVVLRAAEVLADHGFEVSLRSSRPIQSLVDPAHDARVQPPAHSPFNVWADSLDYLFFPGPPDPDALTVAQACRPRLKVVRGGGLADLATRAAADSIRRADRVVAYTQAAEAILAAACRPADVRYAPPVPAYPFLRRPAPRDPPRVAVLLDAARPDLVAADCDLLLRRPGVGVFYRRALMPARRYEAVRAGRAMGYDLRYTAGPELRHTLSLYDLAVCPSRADPAGYLALEALAAGLPVVAYAVSPFNELVDHGDTGRLVAAGPGADAPPGTLDQAVGSLLEDPVRLAHLVVRAGSGLEAFRVRAVQAWLGVFDYVS